MAVPVFAGSGRVNNSQCPGNSRIPGGAQVVECPFFYSLGFDDFALAVKKFHLLLEFLFYAGYGFFQNVPGRGEKGPRVDDHPLQPLVFLAQERVKNGYFPQPAVFGSSR